MKYLEDSIIRKRIKLLILFFITAITISGLTAFPLETELTILESIIPVSAPIHYWIHKVFEGVKNTNATYPFLAYGTDWLAFAHLVIAIAFIGPLRDPIKNIWVIEFGMIACIGIIPLALIAGGIRNIQFYWQLIDISFGVFGIIPLSICRHYIKLLEKRQQLSARLSHPSVKFDELKIYDI